MTEYQYDVAGNLGAKITAALRAKSQGVRYAYTFNRLDTITYPTSAQVKYLYGAAMEIGDINGNVAGRIKQVTDESGVETRRYDDLGQVIQTKKTPVGPSSVYPQFSYTMKYKYDEMGRVLAMTYPDSEVLTYTYDEAGLARSATGQFGSTTTSYVQQMNYDQFGRRTRAALGNTALTLYAYFPDTTRLKNVRTTIGGATQPPVANVGYQYDLVGNIKTMADTVVPPATAPAGGTIAPGSRSFSFGYDDLYQLTSAAGQYTGCAVGCGNSRQYALSMTYDGIGNITKKVQSDTIVPVSGAPVPQPATSYPAVYTYSGVHPHAASSVGTQSLTYDDSGNQLTSTGAFDVARTMTWKEEDRMRTEVDRGATTSFLYDAAGNRTHKRRTTLETVYVNPYYSVRNYTTESKHVMLGETRVATVMATIRTAGDPTTAQSSSAFYYLPDHLQSTNLATNASGAITQHNEYFPSGETWFSE